MIDFPSIDPKAQLIEARRIQILQGAAQVFAQKGFHQATTKEIAKAAGVAEGTIYNYFQNKRDLLVAMIKVLATETIHTIVIDHPPDDLREFLTTLLQDRYQVAQQYGKLMGPIVAEIITDAELRETAYHQIAKPLMAHLEQYLQLKIDAGELHPFNPMVVTRALVGTFAVNFVLKLTQVDPRYQDMSTDTLIEEIVSLFVDGLFESK